MKKILFIISTVLVIAGAVVAGWWALTPDEKTQESDAVMEKVVSDMSYMKDSVCVDSTMSLSWFETCIKMTGEVDTLMNPEVEFMSNVFQVATKVSDGLVIDVWCGKHETDTMYWDVKKNAFWVEDYDMMPYKDSIITFSKAFENLQKANCPKPKSAYCTLRKQVGPVNCNPQYVFGNDNRGLAYVDAVTGEVRTINPAFNRDTVTVIADSIVNFTFKH